MVETDDEDDGAMPVSSRAVQLGPPASGEQPMDVCNVELGDGSSEPMCPAPGTTRKLSDEAGCDLMVQPTDAEADRPTKDEAGAEAPSEAALEGLTLEVAIVVAQDLFAVGADKNMAWAHRSIVKATTVAVVRVIKKAVTHLVEKHKAVLCRSPERSDLKMSQETGLAFRTD